MATQYSNKPIVTDGLVYALDFGNQRSYVSGSTTANSLLFSPFSASINAGFDGTAITFTGSQTALTNFSPVDLTNYESGSWTAMTTIKLNTSGYFMGLRIGNDRFITQLGNRSLLLNYNLGKYSYPKQYEVGRTYAPPAFSTGSYAHLTLRGKSGSIDFFVNGIPVPPNGTNGNEQAAPNSSLALNGAAPFGAAPWSGSLANYYFYNRALTSDEIYSNYLLVAQRYGLSTIPKPYTIDENAYLFLSQSGITDPIITSSIDTFVRGLKSASLWEKMFAIYPFVGTGSAGVNLTGSQRWNLKEPGIYGLTYSGIWNGSTSGSAPSGSNTFIQAGGINPSNVFSNMSNTNTHISILSYDTPVSSSYLMGTGMTEDLAVSTLAGDYGTPAAAYSVRKVRTAYSGALMDVRRSYDNTTGSIGYVSNGDLDTGSLLDFVVAGRAVLPGAYSGLAAAYSLRRVSGSYTGPAIDVRRSYDNTTGSVGFDSNGNLDTSSLFTFVSRGDNLVQYSEELNNGYWSTYDVTVTPNTIIAPDSTLTADTLVFGSTSREFYRSISTPGIHTFSMFVSGTIGQTIWIGKSASGAITRTGSLWTLGAGWQRISASFDQSIGFITLATYDGATARTVYAWGAQLNTGSVALPYVKTVASTKTNESGSFDTVSTGWVAQWYDQSGNGRHATQTTASNQPLIVSSGSLVTNIGGKPSLYFNKSVLRSQPFTPVDVPITSFLVNQYKVFPTSGWYVIDQGVDDGVMGYISGTSNKNEIYNGVYLTYTENIVTGSNYLWYALFSGSNSELDINNVGTVTGSSGTRQSDQISVGFYGGAEPNAGDGYISEFLTYHTNVSSSRRLIENNINNYYNIYTGSNHGFVARWYDQSGNNRHASQTATGSQPLIVLSGSVILEPTSSKPALRFDGINSKFTLTSNINLAAGSSFTSFHVEKKSNSSAIGIWLTNGTSNAPITPVDFSDSNIYFTAKLNASTADYIFINSGGVRYNLLTGLSLNSTSLSNIRKNGAQLTGYTSASEGNSNTFTTLGARGASVSNTDTQEFLLYPSDLTTSTPAIEYGINSYYNIYPQTSSFATSSFTIKADSGSISGSLNNRLTSGIAASGPLGLITVSRTGSNSLTIARNGVTSSFAVPASGALSTGLYLGAVNNNGIAVGNSPVNISFASVGTGLTNTETNALTNLVSNLKLGIAYPQIVTNGLVLYLDAANTQSYPGTGTGWTDLTLYKNNGTLISGSTFDSANGGSILLNGSTGYIDCGTLSLGSTATLNIWFKQTTAVNNKGLIALGNTHFYLSDGGSPLGLTVYSAAPLFQYGPGLLQAGASSTVWTMATFVVNSTNISIFYNGGSKVTGTNTIQTSGNLRLGIYPTLANRFNGNIGLVQIYNRALTDTEVLQNFNATRGRFGV